MDYLQYYKVGDLNDTKNVWVLNLIINGLPSILQYSSTFDVGNNAGFKPYYKWITFNTTS